jgi:hypothetical protein
MGAGGELSLWQEGLSICAWFDGLGEFSKNPHLPLAQMQLMRKFGRSVSGIDGSRAD